MNPLRKLAVVLAVTFLPLALWGAGLTWSIHQVFGTPQHLEGALNTSGIYHDIVGEILSKVQADQANKGTPNTDTIPINQPEVQAIIKQAFPPQYLQGQTNQIVDAIYGWLQGKQPALAFSVDLNSAKQQLANGVGQYAQARLSTLPACTPDQIPSGDVDPFSAACVPPGFDVAGAAAKARDTILNGNFLQNANLTADSIKTSDGKTLGQQLRVAPRTYHKATLGVYALGVLAVLLSVAIIFLSQTWRAGLRKAAIVYISVGAVTVLVSWLITFGLHKAVLALGKTTDASKALEQSILKVVEILAQDVRTYWMNYGLVLLSLGIVGLVVTLAGKKHGMALAHELAGDQNPDASTRPELPTPVESADKLANKKRP
ncbi:MAG TPA: hypothetical protein VKQ34_04085 [Candidatus Saccharimonadales bacterium]|nr:hypothetical protein [Candidatus Saccharimonadales bacterium]